MTFLLLVLIFIQENVVVKVGGVDFLIRKNLKYKSLDCENVSFLSFCYNNKVEISIVELYSNSISFNSLVIINIYSPPRGCPRCPYTENNFWSTFFNYVSKFKNLLICGDFNAKDPLWSPSGQSNIEGDKLLDALLILCV